MDVQQVKEARKELAEEIAQLISKFEHETSVVVTGIGILGRDQTFDRFLTPPIVIIEIKI